MNCILVDYDSKNLEIYETFEKEFISNGVKPLYVNVVDKNIKAIPDSLFENSIVITYLWKGITLEDLIDYVSINNEITVKAAKANSIKVISLINIDADLQLSKDICNENVQNTLIASVIDRLNLVALRLNSEMGQIVGYLNKIDYVIAYHSLVVISRELMSNKVDVNLNTNRFIDPIRLEDLIKMLIAVVKFGKNCGKYYLGYSKPILYRLNNDKTFSSVVNMDNIYDNSSFIKDCVQDIE